jgi:hypothetical protein
MTSASIPPAHTYIHTWTHTHMDNRSGEEEEERRGGEEEEEEEEEEE